MGRAKFRNQVPSMHLRAIVQGEKRRRAVTAAALASLIRHQRDGVVTSHAIRHHLAEYYGRALARACTWDEMWKAVRACRGKVSWSIAGGRRQRHFRGVRIIPAVGFHRVVRSIGRRLDGEGLPAEVPLIRRPLVSGRAEGEPDIDTFRMGTGTELRRTEGGIYLQIPDPEVMQITTDTKNGAERRGRVRRFVPYLARLRLYLETAKMPVEERRVLDLVVAGHTVRAIVAELGVTRWKVQSTIERHQVAAAIPGPGPGC